MMNPKPIGMRKTVQLMVILTLLAWATQTLFHQWGYGGLILTDQTDAALIPAKAAAPAPPPAPEQAAEPAPQAMTLELRSQIKATRTTVTLRDVCRWSNLDQLALEPVADRVLMRLREQSGMHAVSVDQIKSALQEAGVNLSTVRFSGAATCMVIVGEGGGIATSQPAVMETALKDLLLADLGEKLGLSARQLQVDFAAKDAQILALTTPRCRMDFDGEKTAAALGDVAWNVVVQDGKSDRSATIRATARLWEDQLLVTRPLSRGQAFYKTDIAARRVLVDRPTTNPATSSDQVLGRVAARELKRGDVLGVDDIDQPQVVSAGQVITVSLKVGDGATAQTIQTVATALEGGKKGSTIRARNEATKEVYQIHVTAPDCGEVISQGNDIASTGNN